MKEWLTFTRKFSDLKEGRRELFIKDLSEGPRKYDTKHVVATISPNRENLKNPDVLWVRSESGIKLNNPWYIQIEEELPPYVPGRPWQDIFSVLEKGEAR